MVKSVFYLSRHALTDLRSPMPLVKEALSYVFISEVVAIYLPQPFAGSTLRGYQILYSDAFVDDISSYYYYYLFIYLFIIIIIIIILGIPQQNKCSDRGVSTQHKA